MYLSNISMPQATQHDNTVTIYTKSQTPQFQHFKKMLEEVIDRKMIKGNINLKKRMLLCLIRMAS
jgi:hypothetical protein